MNHSKIQNCGGLTQKGVKTMVISDASLNQSAIMIDSASILDFIGFNT